MAARKPKAPVAIPPTLIKQRTEGLTLLSPLQKAATALTVRTAADYTAADALLGRVFSAIATWGQKIAPTEEPLQEAIDAAKVTLAKAKRAMEGLDALNEEIVGPLREAEGTIRTKMADYKREEARLIRESEAEAERERSRLARAIEDLARKEIAAPSKHVATQLAKRRNTLVQEAVQVEAEAESAPAPAKGTASQARAVRVYRCTNLDEVIRGCAEGTIPSDVLMIDGGKMQEYFREPITRTQMDAGDWPGIVVEDDVIIARQGIRRA